MKLNYKPFLVSIAAVLVLGLSFIASVPVAAAQAKSVVTLTYEVQTNRQGKEDLFLIAKVTQENGYPLGERTILFFETVELFGTSRVPVGSAVTSAVGIAALKYETRQAGEHKFTVVYSGDETTASAIVDATLDLQGLPPMEPLEKPVGMEKISYWSMVGAGAVVALVWGLLAFVVVFTVHGIRANSRA